MNDALKNICNAEKAGKRQVNPSPFALKRIAILSLAQPLLILQTDLQTLHFSFKTA